MATKKDKERGYVADLLATLADGSSWTLVDEPDAAESPDALLLDRARQLVVGCEVRRTADKGAAHASGMQGTLATALQSELRRRRAAPVMVSLSFYGNAALHASPKRDRDREVTTLADVVMAHLPFTADYLRIEEAELLAQGIQSVSAIVFVPSLVLDVHVGGGHRMGQPTAVLQRYADSKAEKLAEYQEQTRQRAARLADPPPRVAGVWLLLVAFVGPGMASSVPTRGVHKLSRRGFERVFVLDYFAERLREFGVESEYRLVRAHASDYDVRLEQLVRITVADLTSTRTDAARLRAALARYFKRGAEADFTTGELIDFLGVSSPSILAQAGFEDAEEDRAMKLVGELSDAEIASSST